jgi:hypothetical protein
MPGGDSVSQNEKEKAQAYLDEYFSKIDIKVYWGTSRDFTKELRSRWDKIK